MSEETKSRIAQSQRKRYQEMRENKMLLYDDAEDEQLKQVKKQLAEARNDFNWHLDALQSTARRINKLNHWLRDKKKNDMVEQIARKTVEKIRQTNQTNYDGKRTKEKGINR